jgi:hypothetical protein
LRSQERFEKCLAWRDKRAGHGGNLAWGDPANDWCTIDSNPNQGVFARVWRPWPKLTHIYSVQYFVFLTYNETIETFTAHFGSHDADWLCLDLGVDATNPDDPRIIHAIYFNHGRQFFVRGDTMYKHFIEDGRPVAYMEVESNELWPNAGGRGYGGWPNVNGFAGNAHNDYRDIASGGTQFLIDLHDTATGLFGFTPANSEAKTARSHGIFEGEVWRAWDPQEIPNLGEFLQDPETKKIFNGSLARHVGRFIVEYPGKWGCGGNGADAPESPRVQSKMWNRGFAGPWSLYGGPDDHIGFKLLKRKDALGRPVDYPPIVRKKIKGGEVILFLLEGQDSF